MSQKTKRQRTQQTPQPHPVKMDDTVLLEKSPTVPSPFEALSLIQEIERIRNSRVVTFFAYPDVLVRGDIPLQLYTQLRSIGRVPRIDLFIHSTGGETEVPWRIITLIRNFCQEFSVLIPFMAYSAATHIAMGANEIVMGDMSELGPTDPARSHPLLPQFNDQLLLISVQDLRQCIEFLKREGGQYTPESLATIYSTLFDKVHPLALGAIEQSYALARLISEKALKTHMDSEQDKEKIERIVKAFSDDFFSHQYRIGWREATDLGLPVRYDNGELWEAMWKLYEHYMAFQGLVRPIGNDPHCIGRQIVWLDSTSHRQILEEQYSLSETKDQPQVLKRELVRPLWMRLEWNQNTEQKEEPALEQAGS